MSSFIRGLLLTVGLATASLAHAQPTTVKEPKASADGQTIRLQVYQGAIINLMQWVMVERGFCAAHNMKCELLAVPSAPLGIQAAVAGSLDVVISSADVVVQAAAGGAPVQFVAGLLPNSPFALSMRPGTAQTTASYPENVRAIKGLKIGVTARGAGPEVQVRLLLADAGMDADKDVVFVAVGPPASQYAAMVAKQVDGVMGFEPMPTICEQSPICTNLVDLRKGQGSAIGRGGSGVTYMTSKAFAQKNPKLLDAFRQASAEAIEWASKPENLAEVMAIAKRNFKLGDLPDADAVTERLVKNQVSSYHWQLNRDGIKAYVAHTGKEKPNSLDAAGLFHPKAY